MDTKELSIFKGQISKIETQALEIKIEDNEDYLATIDISNKLKEIGSKIKDTKESITKPLNEGLKNARNLFKPVEEQFEKAQIIVNSKILTYNQKVRKEAEEQEAKIAADLESGKIKKLETAEKKIGAIERVEKTTEGKAGAVQVRKLKKVRITDANLLPREYLIPDEVAIRRDVLGGKNIPGVEIYEEETLANIKF